MPTISRRRFLTSLAAGTGGLVLAPHCLRAGGPPRPPLEFVVVSDTHLGRSGGAAVWERTAAELATAKGELVLHLGDVVNAGEEAQYPVYLATRKTIGKPVHEIPGNHDPAELFEKYVRTPIDTVVPFGWLRFLLVGNAHTDSHDGFLTAGQLAWIDAQCAAAAGEGACAVICMHVPAHTNKHPDRGWYVKPEHGQKELYEVVTRHRDHVLALFHGHFHNGLRCWDDRAPVHEICFPSVLYNKSRRLEEQRAPGYNPLEFRPGYTLVRIADGRVHLRYKPTGEEPSVEHVCPVPQTATT
jgi:3',5'-cyclic AMP phosphodiesterase CpdA